MKKYPRLYSLSTLGIRQHQEFDYLFHGFRTDFVGDSGCGKSMIADLVQLVFVGSDVFASGTDSMDKREVDGMVLRTPGAKGTDMAYVLINIELKAQQYVVIGAYLESSSRHSRSFIIQTDYEESQLKPLSRHLTVADISSNDQIPTMESFKESLEEMGFVLHLFSQRKKFHAYLHRHQLLSIDLSQSTQLLRDYATIIQSFSRGKSLDISDSNSLKRFLFGNEKAKEITQKYKNAVEELQNTLKEHAQNREEIRMATEKYQALKTLRTLKDRLDRDEEDFLTKQCAYAQQQETEVRASFKESAKDYLDANSNLQAVQGIIKKELDAFDDNYNELSIQEEEAKKNYHKTYSQQQKLLPFLRLSETYEANDNELIAIYQQYQKDKRHHQLILEFNQALKNSTLQESLADYLHLESLGEILETIGGDHQRKQALLTQKQQLLAFADLNNEGSLGYWAIQNYQAHSLEVESLLMHFKDLPIFSPGENQERYIPNPQQLLKQDQHFKKDKDGFWINLGEVSQYIFYQKKQLFASADIDELKTLLTSMSQDLQAEVKALEQHIGKLKSLKEFILSRGDFAAYLEIRQHESALSDFKDNHALEIGRQEFEAGVMLLVDAEQIQEDYLAAERNWKDKQQAFNTYENTISGLRKTRTQLENLLTGAVPEFIQDGLQSIFPDLNVDESLLKQQSDYLQSKFEKSQAKHIWIEEVIRNNQQKQSRQDITRQHEEYEGTQVFLKEAFKEARFLLAKEPDINQYQNQYLEKPIEEQNRYQISKELYLQRFSEIVEKYAAGESYRFETSQNYLELCTTVLPDAFLEEEIEKDNSIEIIWEYLSKINDKNKNLNNRKLLKIRDILDEVGDEVSKREDTIRKIHNFLDNGNREITGGHRVSLRANNMHSYPKGWINAYIEKLSSENTLFATGETLSELLSDSVSLEEKMIDAFYTFGGHRGTKPKVENLLNPNSYFDLVFKMESHASGKTNIGSTGQVYAAIALLCIARLSLVNKSSFNKNPPPGIRFMPIDEAEGLGSNFDLLYEIARDFDYQILTMGIKPLGRFKDGEQFIYMLSNNKEVPEDVNYQPFAVFCEADQQF